jgi:hypothetical protein
MSPIYLAHLKCDHPRCVAWSHGLEGATPPSEAALLFHAKKKNWTRNSHGDFCPKHKPQTQDSAE